MSRLTTEQEREERESGILECVGCGMKFKLTDGESVYVDHFNDCEGER